MGLGLGMLIALGRNCIVGYGYEVRSAGLVIWEWDGWMDFLMDFSWFGSWYDDGWRDVCIGDTTMVRHEMRWLISEFGLYLCVYL